MVNFGPLTAKISLGHPILGSVIAQHSSSGRQPNFPVLDRGRHLYSAGRPSRWALADILVFRLLPSDHLIGWNSGVSIHTSTKSFSDFDLICVWVDLDWICAPVWLRDQGHWSSEVPKIALF